MTLCTIPVVGVRSQLRERRPGRPTGGKRLSMVKEMPAKVRSAIRRSLDPSDNSNDSGLGFDHHADHHLSSLSERVGWSCERSDAKRPRMDIKIEHDDTNDRYCFPEPLRTCNDSTTLIRTAPASAAPSLSMSSNQTTSSGRAVPRCIPLPNRGSSSSPIPLTTQLCSSSRYADVSLTILKQPETQHRARYQTEGSRGAVKDREGNGFPVVQLTGYYQPTTLQVFIGTDVGKVAPHMFYQACKVSGKNSTPCMEKKLEGTCVIELQLEPSKEMSATCDCVGILKERNVDVEHRFPDQLNNRSKKKSTRCRMIFRTTLRHEDGSEETLQVCSQPIVCTQPPGIPEICKKSLTSCPASGGLELFVLGKNFLKDTKVYFQQVDDDRHVRWEQAVVPDKEYLQQTHFVCVVPPYRRPDTTEPVTVRLCVVSSGKTSEPHQFVYTPVNGAIPSVHVDAPPPPPQTQFFNKMLWSSSINKREQDLGMMPPPESSMVPVAPRRASISLPSTSDNMSPPLRNLKQEYIDENSQSSIIDPIEHTERYRHISESSLDVHPGDSNMSMITENSISSIMNDNSNLSVNDNSVDTMVRRNSLSNHSEHLPAIRTNSLVTDRMVLSQPPLMQNLLVTASEELKGIDLRMKMPMATVADLVHSTAPSMATLQSFGVTEPSNVPLPAQTAQSIETFLTNIESKLIPNTVSQIIESATFANKMIGAEPVFLTSQRQFMSGTTQSETIQIVAKSEAAAIAEQTLSQTATTTTMATIEATAKLDQLVNSTVESHIGSPTRSEQPKDVMMTNKDVMLNTQPALIVPPMINTTLSMNELTTQNSPNLSPEVILNSQLSPSLMCRTTQDSLLTTVTTDSTLQPPMLNRVPTSPLHSPIVPPAFNKIMTEPEKAVLLEAAVDLFETRKQIEQLDTTRTKIDEIMTMASTIPTVSQLSGNNFVPTQASKSDFVIPVPVKEMTGVATQVDKKTEDRMIPQSFTSLTENELINLINPSCFDQGNNSHYH